MRTSRTRDDLLTGPEPVTRISLGKTWTGVNEDDEPLVAQANYLTQVLGEGCFAAGQVLHAESLENAISLAKVYTAGLEGVQDKLRNRDSMSRARAKDNGRPSGLPGTTPADLIAHPSSEKTKDSRSALFGSARTQDYAATLRKGRETQASTAPARVNTARDYAANLAAGRAKKGAA